LVGRDYDTRNFSCDRPLGGTVGNRAKILASAEVRSGSEIA
jgi:hypothetical protein